MELVVVSVLTGIVVERVVVEDRVEVVDMVVVTVVVMVVVMVVVVAWPMPMVVFPELPAW